MNVRITRATDGFTATAAGGRFSVAGFARWQLMAGGIRSAPVTYDLGSHAEGQFIAYVASRLLYGVIGKRRRSLDLLDEETLPCLRAERRRLLENVPAEVLAVHEAIGRAGGSAVLARREAFFERRLLVRDVLNHRAAAVAVGHYTRLVPELPLGCPRDTASWRERRLEPWEWCTAFDALEEWPALFAPERRSYRSLNRTLMNLPHDFPGSCLLGLREVELPRPITNPIELRMACLVGIVGHRDLTAIVLFATESEIRRAFQRVAAHVRRRLVIDRREDAEYVLRFLADYPEPHTGRLGGLVEKSIAWHRDVGRRGVEYGLEPAGLPEPQTPTTAPPIPPPDVAEIRFLETAGDIAEEGSRMRHCVAFRAPAAVSGSSFIFHVERGEEAATVEVDRHGRIEAQGPSNSTNRAARWGAQMIREWTRGWPVATAR
jgi:hypothetical protein